ncbi:hypothetical protein VZT92_010670 [Zoarces viviparus]|uniref:C-type lectin domain-containing protein n=1 Tax=Zoarces viviparus TaxID=48416 RepID=A0AAW1F9G6_ZOAVI
MDSMEIGDNLYITKHLTMEGIVTKVDFQRRKQPSRCVTVCLGLLCAVLLAGNIGQFIYYEIISPFAPADPTQASLQFSGDRLQDCYDASTAERKQFEAKLSNLTEVKGQLQQSYTALTTERDEFKTSFNNLTNENNQLQASYSTLKQENDQLQTSYNDMQKSHNDLTARKDQLQTNNRNLQIEKDEFQTLSFSLRANRDLLMKDRDRLHSRYNSLQNEKQELQKKYNSLVKVKDVFEKDINKVRVKPCERGWIRFHISCYCVSTSKRNWALGRQDCIARGADLVIIDSREEQAFINEIQLSHKEVWIGLTDSVTEGTWMWVDGTPVTTTYWNAGQPNNLGGNERCGETWQRSSGIGVWNDDECANLQNFICEQ